jgi:hypothetical protein
MSAIKLSTPSSGSISLSPADTASNLTITVPANAGTMLTTGSTFSQNSGPIFSATMSATQTISSATFTKVALDSASAFGSLTNSWDAANRRFLPTIEGYYFITGQIYATGAGWADQSLITIYKNGGNEVRCQDAGAKTYNLTVSAILYMNGTTDYLEVYAYSSSGKTIESSSSLTWVRGTLLMAA